MGWACRAIDKHAGFSLSMLDLIKIFRRFIKLVFIENADAQLRAPLTLI